jgi:hypothetical protein
MVLLVLTLCTWLDWKTLKTGDFTVVYKDEYYFEALQTLCNLEYYKENVQTIIGNGPKNVPVVIEDVGALSNGFANPIFHNVHVFTHAPGFAYRMEGIEDWYRTVTVHEYAHILHLSKTRGVPRVLTSVFGPLFAPNIYSPGWIIEGITVFSESQNSPYEGRLNDGFFDSCISARVQSNAMPSIVEATNTPMDFPFGAYYLYGGEFFDFLAQRYGQDRSADFFGRYGSYFWAPISGIFPSAGLDIAARRTYGKSFPGLFREWQEYEMERWKDTSPVGMKVTDKGWYLYSMEEENGKIYYVRDEPLKVDGFAQRSLTHIIEFDPRTCSETVISSLSGVITAPLRINSGMLYYTTREFAWGYSNTYYGGFGIVANLHERDLVNGTDRILLTDNIRAFCVLPEGAILYSKDRLHDFGSELWLCDGEENVLLFDTELLINELDASEQHVAAVARHDFENWNIYMLDFEEGVLLPAVATPWIEGSINLTNDAILFTANYGGVYALYQYDPQSRETYQLTKSGYAEHGVVISGMLYFKGMSTQGFDVYRTPHHAEVFDLPRAMTSERPDFENMALSINRGGYGDVLKTLLPSVRLPLIFPTGSDLDAWTYGLALVGGDATNENLYGCFLGSETGNGDLVGNMLWQSRFFAPFDVLVYYDHANSVEYSVACPMFRSLEYGFSNLTLHLDGRLFDDLARKEFSPGIDLGFRLPYTAIGVGFSFPFERQAWGSDVQRGGQEFRFRAQRLFRGGELRVTASVYIDRHNPDLTEFRIRGYEIFRSRRASVLNVEYSHRLCQIRWGLWNPNFYFEDLYWTVFGDYLNTQDAASHYSFGCELGLEVKVGFGFVQLFPKIGVARTKDNEFKMYFKIAPFLPI